MNERKKNWGYVSLLFGFLAAFAPSAIAFQKPAQPALPNFDQRALGANKTAARAVEQGTAAAHLKAQVPEAQVQADAVLATPRWIAAPRGFLSGRNAVGRGISPQTAAGFAAGEAHRATKGFLKEHAALFGHGPEVLAGARLKREFVTAHSGMKTAVWEQQLDGISIFEGLLISHTTRNDELVALSSRFLPDPERAVDAAARGGRMVRVTAPQAVAKAAQNVGENLAANDVAGVEAQPDGAEARQHFRAATLKGPAQARLVWLPMNRALLRLCWEVILTSRRRDEMFRVLIDAQTGEALVRHCLTAYLSDATYRVFTSDSPSPLSPGYATRVTNQPPLVQRVLVVTNALDTNASPHGWINDGDNETRGNNVDAHTDLDANDLADLPRPQGSPLRVFDFPLDLSQDPSSYRSAAVVQLFYWNNWMHDKLYTLGFTEAAGNFQADNFGRGGYENDPVMADAQDGGGFNNANFAVTPDGSGTPPRMQMYIFNGPTPRRDGDLDAEVILHEYTHGLSNRRVGGGVGIMAPQSGGLGEGWSDFYALAMLSDPGEDVNGVYAFGAYVTYLYGGLQQNYYFGIRRYPYCIDLAKNPLTFKDIDPSQADPHPGIPVHLNPDFESADEVHNQGEVWCVTLREARANLIRKYGGQAGNWLMLQLTTDGMNLTPPDPTFVQARDGILLADQVYNDGANYVELWAAFAKRGLGFSAAAPDSSTTLGVREAFDVPFLTLHLVTPPTAREGDGILVGQGQAILPSPLATNLVVYLVSSNTAEVTVPASVIISAGQTNASFDITILDDAILDGTQNVPITGSAPGFASGASMIAVSDNESTNLLVNLPLQASEAAGILTNGGSVLISGALRTNLTVSLTSSDPGRLSVPLSVTIVAGQTAAAFDLTLQNNTIADGNEVVTVTAQAENFSAGGASITILDDEGPAVPGQPYPPDLSSNISARLQLSWKSIDRVSELITNGGFETGDLTGWVRTPSPSGDFITDDGTFDPPSPDGPLPPYAGRYSVLAEHSGPANHSLYQQFTIPVRAQSARLSWAHRLRNFADDWSSSQQFRVELQDTNGTQLAQAFVTQPGDTLLGDWVTNSFDLTSFSGQNLRVVFIVSLGAGPLDVHLDNVSVLAGFAAPNTYDIYFGTNPNPGPIEFQGSTTNTNWNLPLLAPWTTYYWRIVSRAAGLTAGPAWQFTTRGLDHFGWSVIPSPQMLAQPFSVTLTAQDEFNTTVTNYAGSVSFGASSSSPVSPAASDPFTNGVWTGNMAVQAVVRGVSLQAEDAAGHTGQSNPFDVGATNDLTVMVIDSPRPVPVGASLGYTLSISNSGPSAATGVRLTNYPPVNAALISFSSSQGGCSNVSGTVLCDLGEVAAGASATVTLVVVPAAVGFVTNAAIVSQVSTDPFLPNNTAVTVTEVTLPSLSISDRSVPEGNLGTVPAVFTVVLSGVHTQTVTVSYSTADGTAVGGSDYVATNGTLAFSPGVSTQTLMVLVRGDILVEGDETFFVNLSSPTNGIIGRSQGLGTILNDDGLPGRVDHFAWGMIPATQYVSQPFAVTLTAQDAFNATVTNFTNTVTFLSASPLSQGIPGVKDAPISQPVAAMPVRSDAFTNGLWTGNITVLEPVTNLVLRAIDDEGHQGSANPLAVLLQDDIGVTVNISPDPVGPGETLTYSIIVTNIGPSAATGVALTNVLPSNASFVSVTASQGACSNVAGTILCDLGTLLPNTNALVTILTTPAALGFLTNRVTISRLETDAFPGNNSATNVTRVLTFTLSIDDASVMEGDAGTTNAVFNVQLSPPTSQAVQVDYATADGTAEDGSDYLGAHGTLRFLPGETNQTILVPVLGDTILEYDETFLVNLSNPSNAVLGRSQAIGTILNDEPIAQLSISDVAVVEGNVGLTKAVFTVSLFPASSFVTTVQYATSDGSGTAPSDYIPASGVLTFNPGQTNAIILVSIRGDILTELDETFYVTLTNPTYSIIGKSQGIGTILNDDGLPGRIDHFAWAAIASTQYLNQPFAITLTAQDAFNAPVTDFTNSVAFMVQNTNLLAAAFLPSASDQFTNGLWSGTITVLEPVTNLVLLAVDDQGHQGAGDAFAVVLHDDIGVAVTASPDLVGLGDNVTYSILVTNIGPSSAKGVVLTNFLDSGATFVSVAVSQGACSNVAGTVLCDLGTLAANTNALITVVATPLAPGAITNWVGVARAEEDGFPGNNVATNLTLVQTVLLSVNDTSLAEGNSGFTNAVFDVHLWPPTTRTVQVQFATSNGTATAGSDYVSTNGVLVFLPGQTNQTVLVPVLGDIVWEPDETFLLNLFNPTNASLSRTHAVGTINNDDPFPILSISDAVVYEGNSGTTNASFAVSVFPPSSQTISFDYYSMDGSARAPGDYVSTGYHSLTLSPGQTNTNITVLVHGDLLSELDETFFVYLTNPNNAQIGRNPGVGLILDDDNPIFRGRDLDSNGLPDAWEMAHFGHTGVDPSADPDHDGMSNLQEYLAGTDPNDPASVLAVQLVDAGNGGARLRFLAMPGISYSLEYRTNLTQGTWQKLSDVSAQLGTNQVEILDPDAAAHGPRFYRLATPQQP